MKTRKLTLICVCIVLITATMGFSLYTILNVKIAKGTVSKMSDIPVIGTELSGFPAEAEIQYLYRKYFGGAGVYFSGTVSYDAIKKYFEDYNWDNSLESTTYDDVFSKEPCFPIIPSQNNEVFVKLPNKKTSYKIIVYYMPNTNTFSGMALIFNR